MKKKVLLSSIVTIALCLCLIAGSTFALFTDKTEVNIAVTAGDVEVLATAGIKAVYSAEETTGEEGSPFLIDEKGNKYVHAAQTLETDADGKVIGGTFFNGGAAEFDGSTLQVKRITPGDKIEVDINVENKSNVAIAYRYKMVATGANLAYGMVVTIDGTSYERFESWTSAWYTLGAPDGTAEQIQAADAKTVAIELPVYAGNEYQSELTEDPAKEMSVTYTITVEAVQSNAVIENEAEVTQYPERRADTVDDLISALEEGKDVILMDDLKIDPANMSNAYGATGINVKNGQTIDGNGNILDIQGAGGTWDSGINTTGGLIKNLTVTGSFRGIFINHNSDHSETVVLENVTIDGTVYTISCDQGLNQNFEATSSTFKGWTSYAATLGTAKFTDCYFGEGSGYAFCRPYAPTNFVGCEFEAGFEIDPRAAITFENCTIDGVALTAENLATLVTSNIQNASVK